MIVVRLDHVRQTCKNCWRRATGNVLILRYIRARRVQTQVFIWFSLVFLVFAWLKYLGYAGIFCHPFEKDYFTEFSYPLEGDVPKYAAQLERGDVPDVTPINDYNYPFLIPVENKCRGVVRLLLVVKSAVSYFDRRILIRRTWGWEKRFPDVEIRRVFVLGVLPGDTATQERVRNESRTHGDIVQVDYIDSYFNNTIKTMMAFRWVIEKCQSAQFVMFVDDDMYLSVNNLLRFLQNPKQYPSGNETAAVLAPMHNSKLQPPDLLAGYVRFCAPIRNRGVKWVVTLEEYPFHMYPPYLPAGAYVVSFGILRRLYFASKFTKHFRFDDIFLSIVARKANLVALHQEMFYYSKMSYSNRNFKNLISSHGFDNMDELLRTWTEQYVLGNA